MLFKIIEVALNEHQEIEETFLVYIQFDFFTHKIWKQLLNTCYTIKFTIFVQNLFTLRLLNYIDIARENKTFPD